MSEGHEGVTTGNKTFLLRPESFHLPTGSRCVGPSPCRSESVTRIPKTKHFPSRDRGEGRGTVETGGSVTDGFSVHESDSGPGPGRGLEGSWERLRERIRLTTEPVFLCQVTPYKT